MTTMLVATNLEWTSRNQSEAFYLVIIGVIIILALFAAMTIYALRKQRHQRERRKRG
jgi:preprotein translocase subunit YajC